jgi:hypothetical protein
MGGIHFTLFPAAKCKTVVSLSLDFNKSLSQIRTNMRENSAAGILKRNMEKKPTNLDGELISGFEAKFMQQ